MSLWSEVSSRNHGGVSSQNHGGVSNSKLPNVRICRAVCTDRHEDDDVDAIQNCRMTGSVELFTNIDITSKTETYIMSESVELCAQIGMRMIMLMPFKIAECQDP